MMQVAFGLKYCKFCPSCNKMHIHRKMPELTLKFYFNTVFLFLFENEICNW